MPPADSLATNDLNELYETIDWLYTASMDDALDMYELLAHDDRVTRILAQEDRFFLLTHILARVDCIHPWLYDRCREVEADADGRLDLWSRYHYKSTIITYAGAIQEVIKNPNITIGIFSHTKGIARAFLAQIKREFESNELLKGLFPEIFWEKPSTQATKWSESDGICVNRKANPKEQTIEAYGLVDGMPTSRHFSLRIYDDVVTAESVNTPEQIQKTTERLELSYSLGEGADGNREWFAGTRYSFADTYSVMLDRESVVPRIYPATDDGTFTGNPVLMTVEAWELLKKKTSTYTIACQQLLNPVAGSEQTFSPDWIRRYEVRPLALTVAILCDPAHSRKKTSDRTAFAVIGIDAQRNKYLLDGMCHRMKLADRWKMLRYLRNRWISQPGIQQVVVGYERYGHQSDIEHFQEMMKISGQYFPIEEVNWPKDGPGGKIDRVNRLQPDFQHWRFFLPYEGRLTSLQKEAESSGHKALISRPIMRKDEDGRIYNLVDWFLKSEYNLMPAIHPDFMDAMSRIYDVDIAPPSTGDQYFEPEETETF